MELLRSFKQLVCCDVQFLVLFCISTEKKHAFHWFIFFTLKLGQNRKYIWAPILQ